MVMRWLMTVQAFGVPSPFLASDEPSVLFDLSPRWIAPPDAVVSDEPPVHPHCFDALRYWPSVVEIRRPDGTRVSVELRQMRVHYTLGHTRLTVRDEAGRVRNPWSQQAVLMGLRASDVPPGSEIWGEVSDEAFRPPSPSRRIRSQKRAKPGKGRERKR